MTIKNRIKSISIFFATVTIFAAVTPTVSVLASEIDNSTEVINDTDMLEDILSPEELNDSDLEFDVEAFIKEMESDPEISNLLEERRNMVGLTVVEPPKGQFQVMGVKTQAAKAAIKAMIKTLTKIGKKKWTSMVAKVPKSVAQYLKYQTVMEVLNIAANFQGKVEDMLARGDLHE